MTQQGVVDLLAGMEPPFRISHASIGRIERGKQKPNVGLIEALVIIYHTRKIDWF